MAIREKNRPKCACEAQWASNGLKKKKKKKCESQVIRYMASRHDGHPSCDQGLKRRTFSVDPHWLALRIGFHLSPSTMQLPLRSTL